MKKRLQRLTVVALLIFGQVAGLVALPARASADQPVMTSYTIPFGVSPTNRAYRITTGPDGALWFTMRPLASVFRVTTSGVYTEYPIGIGANDLTTGPDGALWVTGSNSKVARVTTAGEITTYDISPRRDDLTGVLSQADPYGITTGPDGALWFTDLFADRIGRLSTSGEVTMYNLPRQSTLTDIVAGPDGALWFNDLGRNKIGRITTSGVITHYDIPVSETNAGPLNITVGPDGALWFGERNTSLIGRMTTTGEFAFHPLPLPSAQVNDITAGPDGALWFTESSLSSQDTPVIKNIGRMAISGEVQRFPVISNSFPVPQGITAGPDGALWFTQEEGNRIGRITAPPVDVVVPQVKGAPEQGPNSAGWYTNDVTIAWSSTDPAPSSGTPTTPPPTLADQEGTHTYTSAPSCDPAGNCASGTITLSIDKTVPDIAYSLSTPPNAAGWNSDDVTVTFTCSDAVSGVASCSNPVTVGEGANQTVTGTAVDVAGNTKILEVTLSVDKTKPTIAYQSSPAAPNAAGWYNTDVTVSFQCLDELSGLLSCSDPVTASSEAAGQNITGTATDIVGNVQSATATVSIDKTVPALGAFVWSANPKTIMQSTTLAVPVTDNLAGAAGGEYFIGDSDPGQGSGATMGWNGAELTTTFGTSFQPGVYKISVRAQDAAGNWSAATHDYLVVYDPLGLSITGRSTVVPSLSTGDVLPGLISSGQDDKAKFAFNVKYNSQGVISNNSDMMFDYSTGVKCNNPAQATNCHQLKLNATNIEWLVINGANDSEGIFQGVATLMVDGATTSNPFRVTALDGGRLDPNSDDYFMLNIYAPGANPAVAMPLYQVAQDVLRGSIRIR